MTKRERQINAQQVELLMSKIGTTFQNHFKFFIFMICLLHHLRLFKPKEHKNKIKSI